MKKRGFCILLAALLLGLSWAAFASEPGYTVEFRYGGCEYVLPGDSCAKLSDILATLGIPGAATHAEVSDPALFTAEKDPAGGDWTVTALQAFHSEEWMKVTVGGKVHEIVVTDEQEPVPYLYWDYTESALVEGFCTEYTVIDASTVEPAEGYELEDGKWYVVKGAVTFEKRVRDNNIFNYQTSRLILTDGCSLIAKEGIDCGFRATLYIYGQSAGTGTLTATSATYQGIGGNSLNYGGGHVIIDGGNITATGGTKYWTTTMNYSGYAGIGGNRSNVTINGGTVTATGGAPNGAGIGCAGFESAGEVTINGGTVVAQGAPEADGIGKGVPLRPSPTSITVILNGGNVTATGGASGCGIGGTLEYGDTPYQWKVTAGLFEEIAADVPAETYLSDHAAYPYAHLEFATADYAVNHLLEKAVLSGAYELRDTDTLSGPINGPTKAAAKEYAGYRPLPFDQSKIEEKGTVVEIRYDLIYNTLTFDANGHGTAPEPLHAAPGSAIGAPEDPSAEGYVFGGWYTEAKCINGFTFDTMPAEDTTLYAKWEPVRYEYKIIKGANQSFPQNAASAVFASDAPFNKFVRLEIDGSTVDAENYTAKSGSTVITLNRKYISMLKEGAHTLRIVSSDGAASTQFKVIPAVVPKTGDGSLPLLWALLLGLSLLGVLTLRRRTAR